MHDLTPQKILILRTDRMGDVILSTPVATALKRRYPEARITFLVQEYTAPLLEGHPDIDDVLVYSSTFQGRRGLFRLIRELRQRQFGMALLLHPDIHLALAVFLAGIPQRVGSGYRFYSFLFTRPVFEHRRSSQKHEVDLNLSLAARVGAPTNPVAFRLAFSQEARTRVGGLLRELGIKPENHRPRIIVHPGSGGSARDWPPDRFGKLAERLGKKWKGPIFVTGLASERDLVDRVVAASSYPLLRLDGQLDLPELAALIETCDLLIANSTGPLHLAVALNRPVVGLYCPTTPCHPRRWGPYGRPHSVILPPVPECPRCTPEKCPYGGNCMELISVDDVFKVSHQILQEEKP